MEVDIKQSMGFWGNCWKHLFNSSATIQHSYNNRRHKYVESVVQSKSIAILEAPLLTFITVLIPSLLTTPSNINRTRTVLTLGYQRFDRLLLSIVIRTTETILYSTVSMPVIRSVQERADEACWRPPGAGLRKECDPRRAQSRGT